jgi:hypothetical protein
VAPGRLTRRAAVRKRHGRLVGADLRRLRELAAGSSEHLLCATRRPGRA